MPEEFQIIEIDAPLEIIEEKIDVKEADNSGRRRAIRRGSLGYREASETEWIDL